MIDMGQGIFLRPTGGLTGLAIKAFGPKASLSSSEDEIVGLGLVARTQISK